MRLQEAVVDELSLGQRAMQGFARLVMGASPDVFRVHMFRQEVFGGPYGETTQDALRGESDWSRGERELFAATVSSLHGCQFCSRAHGTFAKAELRREGAAYDPTTLAGAPERVRAARDLLEAIANDEPVEKPIEALRLAGADDDAIEDVIDIATSFTIINRIADALQFDMPNDRGFARMTPVLRQLGYRAPGWNAGGH